MNTTSANSAAQIESTDDRGILVWRELVERLDEDGRKLLMELDSIHSDRLVPTEERVLATAGRLCQQFGQPALFEVIYLEVLRETHAEPGDGLRWLTSLLHV